MKRFIIAGNWKMNMTRDEIEPWSTGYTNSGIESKSNVTKIICPPFPLLPYVREHLSNHGFLVGAQNVSEYEKGAYTGEVSANILKSIDVAYCIVGHSERRQYFHETDEIIREKWLRLRCEGLHPIICVGETLTERESGETLNVIKKQISTIFAGMDLKKNEDMMIAYEPVWAIGTGKTATPEMAQEVHKYIRQLLHELYRDDARYIPILYGGSVKPSNLKELLSMGDINGALVGGASLSYTDVADMVKIAGEV
jgi:triosephosphate isomerase